MAALTINQLIKLIIGIFVFVIVVGGLYWFLNNYIIDFFKNIVPEEPAKFILLLLN
jgi:Kef-type K+ transport system membrane component KefB